MEHVKKFFNDTFNLRVGSASAGEIYDQVQNGARIQGSNVWILILAIFIASIGLNMNSTAVVIGAMLISPLMGNIISIGYGLATSDVHHAKIALLKFLLQIGVCLITSTVYFALSPISTAGSELLARTQPTVWDVMIACFGGFAGVIGITRKEKTNVIPGVAIATALMPPLCTAGYGIACGSMAYFGGAMYLFFINSFFICVTAIIVLKILRIPTRKYEDPRAKTRSSIYIGIIAVIVILPSIYFGYQIVNKTVMENSFQNYVKSEFDFEQTQVVRSQMKADQNMIEVALVGKTLSDDQIAEIAGKLKDYGLGNMTLRVNQTRYDAGISKEDVQNIIDQEMTSTETQQESEIKDLQDALSTYQSLLLEYEANEVDVASVEKELRAMYPQVKSVSAAALAGLNEDGTKNHDRLVAVVETTQPLTPEEKDKIESWLAAKTGKTEAMLFETTAAGTPEPVASPPREGQETVTESDGTKTTTITPEADAETKITTVGPPAESAPA